VKIMLPWDPNNQIGHKKPLPDHMTVLEPKEDSTYNEDLNAGALWSEVTAVPPPVPVQA